MPPELIAAIAGPILGAAFGITGFMSRRSINVTDKQLEQIAENIEVISHQVTNLQITLPTKYVSKEELAAHSQREEAWHTRVLNEIRELREEIIVLRVNHHG